MWALEAGCSNQVKRADAHVLTLLEIAVQHNVQPLPADQVEPDAGVQPQGPQPLDLRLWKLIGGGADEPPPTNVFELPKGGW